MNLILRCIVVVVVASLGALSLPAVAAEIRIAVAAEGAEASASVSGVAARAPHLLVFDAKGSLLSSTPNPAAREPGGAATVIAKWLREREVTAMIAGNFGSNLEKALRDAKIRAVVGKGPADAAASKEAAR